MQEKIVFESAGLKLSGVLEFPRDYAAGQKRAAIIVIHGFGSNKEGANVREPAAIYTDAGYIALRFDMRSCGQSEGEPGRIICLEQVEDTRNAIGYLASRPEIDPARIALSGTSAGAAISIYTGGLDARVSAVISAGGWGNGERKLQGQHPSASAWAEFKQMLERGREHRARTGKSLMVSRYDIVPIPPSLRASLPPGSVMEFPAETAQSIFDFRPEDMLEKLAPRPLLLLHAAHDSVTPTSESIELFRRASPPTELHLFHGVDHFMLGERNDRVTEVLRSWLATYFPAR